jgi:DNA polymerase II large subunit
MDAPLVLAIRLDPNEIDKEAHNIDVLWEYPLAFYHATMEMKHPKDVQDHMDMVANRINSLLQYEGFGFTLDTNDISEGPSESSYKTLGSMTDKMNAQLRLARMIRAVDEQDAAQRIISKHFLPDLIGNLKQFSGQKVRCTKCGASYRRVPLAGKCYCGNNLTLTVHEASVKKYLAVTKRVGQEYQVSQYIQQRVGLIEESLWSIFGRIELDPNVSIEDLDSIQAEEAMDSAPTLDSFCTANEISDTLIEEEMVTCSPLPEKPLQPEVRPKGSCKLDDFF